MSTLRHLFFFALLAAFGSRAQALDCDCNPLADFFKMQILAVEKDRYSAMTKADLPALEKLLTNDLVYTHSTGNIQTKSAFLDDLNSGKMRYRKVETRTPIVRLYGDMAIVNGAGDFDVTLEGRELQARLAFTAVYVLKGEDANRRWQLTSWHSSAIPAEAAAAN